MAHLQTTRVQTLDSSRPRRFRSSAAVPSPWVVLAVVATGLVMILVDTTIINIALPSLIAGLGASFDEALWAINAYLLVYAVVLVPAGRLGDRYGPRNLFATGLLLFIGASVACGLAQNGAH